MTKKVTSKRGIEMLSYLPPYYETSRVMKSVIQFEGIEFDELRKALDETLDQFFVRSSTWYIETWEEELGLIPAEDQPLDERKDRVVSKIRGTGSATIRLVKEVAESYDKGSVDVIEDYSVFTITVEFVDTLGVPPNIDDLKKAVRNVVPAHLEVNYEFRYTLVGDLVEWSSTVGDLINQNVTVEELKTWKPA
nr:hypothetical protein 2 [Pelagibacterales bacterium]